MAATRLAAYELPQLANGRPIDVLRSIFPRRVVTYDLRVSLEEWLTY